MKVTENQQPLISIDVVPLRFNAESGQLEVGTGRRLFEPFVGEQALPGVLLMQGEGITHAARRALNSKTGIMAEHAGHLSQLGAFDGTNRDPRGATISIALLAATEFGRTPSTRVTWTPVSDLGPLPFDHDAIVKAAVAHVAQTLFSDTATTERLLGKTFSTSSAMALCAALDSWPTHQTNFSRWLATYKAVSKVEGKTVTVGRGRPSAVWRWSAAA